MPIQASWMPFRYPAARCSMATPAQPIDPGSRIGHALPGLRASTRQARQFFFVHQFELLNALEARFVLGDEIDPNLPVRASR